MKIWTVLGMAAIIWFLSMITGAFNSKTLFALLFFVLIGAIFPPFAVGMGAVVILYLLLVKGRDVTSWITSKVGGGNGQ